MESITKTFMKNMSNVAIKSSGCSYSKEELKQFNKEINQLPENDDLLDVSSGSGVLRWVKLGAELLVLSGLAGVGGKALYDLNKTAKLQKDELDSLKTTNEKLRADLDAASKKGEKAYEGVRKMAGLLAKEGNYGNAANVGLAGLEGLGIEQAAGKGVGTK